MKNLPRVLVFSTVLVLAAGCRKNTGEAPGPGDAAASAPEDSGAAPSDGMQTGTSRGAVTSTGDAGMADAGTPDGGTRAMAPAGGASREAQEACVDKWLKANKLDKYGHDEGTMYAGGTPLFDERTGESRDRLDYVYERKPEARKACGGGPAAK
jgi:hypothetical protein